MRLRFPVRVQRHELGPRCFVLGVRLHEVAAGIALLVAGVLLAVAHVRLPGHLTFIVLAAGGWLTAKDWPDLFPSKRNTRAWRPLVHRTLGAPVQHAVWLPRLAGGLAAGEGALNVTAVLFPGLSRPAYDLTHLGAGQLVFYAHALALAAGVMLLTLSYYLARRRQRSWVLAIGLLAGLTVLSGVRGDLDDAALSAGLGVVLVRNRDAFPVQSPAQSLTVAGAQAVALLAGALVAVVLCTAAGAHWGARHPLTLSAQLRDALALFSLQRPPVPFDHGMRFLTLGSWTVSVGALLVAAHILLGPLVHRRPLPGSSVRAVAAELVRSHGYDTLSSFKLRQDQHYFFSADRSAFVAYRVEAGVLLIAGDPVGPAQAVPGLLAQLASFAEAHGLKLGCVGASEPLVTAARSAGLRAFYIGDEAIIDVRGFSLEGRAIRKVRQSVTRLTKAGYEHSVHRLGELSPSELVELESVSARWRGGQPERGFSMAMDRLSGEHLNDSLIVIARDHTGTAHGFLHFVPCHGRPAMSLSFMRRERDTPNGLTEFLVVAAIEALRHRGIDEVSLNFAAFGRWLRDPANRREALMAAVMRRLDHRFQIESLYRFNAKFFPRWAPRYLLYDNRLALPRTALAAVWAEGQLPKLGMPRPRRDGRVRGMRGQVAA